MDNPEPKVTALLSKDHVVGRNASSTKPAKFLDFSAALCVPLRALRKVSNSNAKIAETRRGPQSTAEKAAPKA